MTTSTTRDELTQAATAFRILGSYPYFACAVHVKAFFTSRFRRKCLTFIISFVSKNFMLGDVTEAVCI